MVPHASPAGNGPLPQTEPIAAPPCRGFVASSAAAALQPLLAGLPEPGDMRVVKSSTVRTVLRGAPGGLDVHLKLYRAVTLSDRARDRLRGDRGTREAHNLAAATALGLPAATPLAFGTLETSAGARAFLVTRTIEGAQAFSFDAATPILQATGALLRRAHDHGLLPADLHPGNVVFDRVGQPWLLDLTKVEHRGDPDLRRRAAGLAFFCQDLDGGPLDDRARPLLVGYLTGGRELPDGFAGQLALATRRLRARALASFGRRAERPCRHTAVARDAGGTRWRLHRIADEVDREALHAACRRFLAAPPTPDKTGRRGAVWLGEDLVVKRRQQGAARRLFAAMYWLLYAKVPQPEPVALATFDGTGHVFGRRLPAPPLSRELASGRLADAELRDVARRLGDAVGRLHAHGLRNRDLKLENLVRDPSTGDVCMTDLDGVRRKAATDTRGQGRDLGRLLAAFRQAGAPGGAAVVGAFARAYLRARRRLLQPAPARRVFRRAAQRAAEWQRAHATG